MKTGMIAIAAFLAFEGNAEAIRNINDIGLNNPGTAEFRVDMPKGEVVPATRQAGRASDIAIQKPANETPIVFESRSGEQIDAFEGEFTVPENRADPKSRMITLRYVRFPATSDQYNVPTVYLAGGPGGSGIRTAKGRRFPLFMAMREFGDVIAFDQRGTGASNDLPDCDSSKTIKHSTAISDQEYDQLYQAAFAECLTFWKREGVDIHGYNTRENAADLDSLRRHLGTEKINLWGISYGSHLALAALKKHDQHINRVVMTAIEGLEQTVKLPARSDQYFDRLQDAINLQPDLKQKFPVVKAMIKRVLQRVEQEPLVLDITSENGEMIKFLVQKRDLQQLTGGMAADPTRMLWMLDIYRALDNGITKPLASVFSRFIDHEEEVIAFGPMSSLMDVASGTSKERRKLIIEQGKTSLLGLQLNGSLAVETVDPSLDLGDAFRQAPVSDVPTLVFTGTLDGRTFPKSGQEATQGLSQKQAVTVINGGHNLFMLSPEVTEVIQAFMRGENVDGRKIFIPMPKL
jgi:pimeloyl-ACP methyl ester carboxylesterase